jgi:hypothetical protein
MRQPNVSVAVLLLVAGACAPGRDPAPAPAPAVAVPVAAPGTCAPASEAEFDGTLVRYACRGSGQNEAAGFSVLLPAGWEVLLTDSLDITLRATDGDRAVWVVGGDQLPAPQTAEDTANFWMAATEIALRRGPTRRDVGDYRFVLDDDPARARRWVTDEQMEALRLTGLAGKLTAEREGRAVIRRVTEVRPLAGGLSGYLDEVVDVQGPWHTSAYVTVRDAVVYIVSFNAPEEDVPALLPMWERIAASFVPDPRRH